MTLRKNLKKLRRTNRIKKALNVLRARRRWKESPKRDKRK
jgi:hypothetical protein|tara:strand:+ start:628 stop:747 length:120 start_codon:yes stop_codon:yes gene_type:complete